MELGVDISQLNVVNMRNMPPTPANYAQRSGRAGRSGQPALVFSYATTGSPHDQYFFKRPTRMVSGEVTPPRIELANEDLVRAHLQAIWLKEADLYLGKSLTEILDVEGSSPSLAIKQQVRDTLQDPAPKRRALARADRLLATFKDTLLEADWYTETWASEIFQQIELNFESACARWRDLARAALAQTEAQNKIVNDASRPPRDRDQAVRLRREAESQYRLLTESDNVLQSDFYSYRYFASEGFLPGYNFPRLPISAFIPSRRGTTRDEFLSRPRFLAITEFGPRAMVYHEGSRYLINKVILPVGPDGPSLSRLKRCPACGYLHPLQDHGPDLCHNCATSLDSVYSNMMRLQSVSTKRRDKINSDEEERLRLGYETIIGYEYATHRGKPSHLTAQVSHTSAPVVALHYGHAATLWRINLGWTRRKERNQFGFSLDLERGYWQRNEADDDDRDEDASSRRIERVIPYVEDRRNSLILEPLNADQPGQVASLAYALKNAIQIHHQLEDSELAVELLPNPKQPRYILFYESAEGGAGVLRRILRDPLGFPAIARKALEICHFDPDTGEDWGHAKNAKEVCEAACYDCLLSYSNQMLHKEIDRKLIRDTLLAYRDGSVAIAPVPLSREDHLQQLLRLCDSTLEKQWLEFLDANNLNLPSHAQQLIPEAKTRPDFYYASHNAAIYIDGPHHLHPDRQQRDSQQEDAMLDLGYLVLRFTAEDDWAGKTQQFRSMFGANKPA